MTNNNYLVITLIGNVRSYCYQNYSGFLIRKACVCLIVCLMLPSLKKNRVKTRFMWSPFFSLLDFLGSKYTQGAFFFSE